MLRNPGALCFFSRDNGLKTSKWFGMNIAITCNTYRLKLGKFAQIVFAAYSTGTRCRAHPVHRMIRHDVPAEGQVLAGQSTTLTARG